MERMSKLDYLQVGNSANENNPNEVTFSLKPLERGFGNTLAVALRRVVLSNITSLALFAIRIENVSHEFQTISGIVEDVTAIIMNLRKVKFSYDPEFIDDGKIIKATLKSDQIGVVTSKSIDVENPSVEIINKSQEIATIQKGTLNIELYLRPGRGFVSNEENKKFIQNDSLFASKIESNIKKGLFIATDSNFSPIEKVKYDVQELNSSSNKIEEELLFTITTDGTVSAKNALAQASEILIAHIAIIGDVDKMSADIFVEEKEIKSDVIENDLDISQLGLSVRSLNALRRIGKMKASEVAAMTWEELEQTKNLGRKSLDEIQECLKLNGFTLSKGDE
ncbi:DNA-directed RNA polymerase subunit alpha [Mycoplasma tauri]|uniref:DNA-directed RNA polymerase subunit alpha n=1 Tax=Mycoplasma tauri TaxID=547987 RepID=A0A953NDM8_9MOLU|nr:DNA-directed RNA polymerase subunit alpha [Mycoplasma tauri]MBZ4195574.1 DNA-directed RNA polymerase subunit alpha [Mycoplasma tauri]MBZ4203479.1 DNA-directed RNA polymerase subunit alpha [Mycoplasma tauri]MBZ4204388.1 DNA-directed RNA polymerase subunit alpha [Mycoplasma tauri]MBZ4212948.1 DNA-directed RNA polymerase subunit alpha [Mycoplasma tauri]MBZ4218393.1 DNA-directed RNA polymerase subunit alpha [Mycoplasma tauri]